MKENFIKDSRLVVFTSVKGGCGLSFITNCVASYLAKTKNKNILLLDSNIGKKDSRIIFEINENVIRDIGDIKENANDVDLTLLKKIVVNFENSLNLILPSLKFEKNVFEYYKNLSAFIELLLNTFDLVIIDLPQYYFFSESKFDFESVDKIVVVSGADNICINNLEVLLSNFFIEENEYKIDIIINKFNFRPFTLGPRLINSISLPVKAFIPYDKDIDYLYNLKGPFYLFNYCLRTIKAISSYSDSLYEELF